MFLLVKSRWHETCGVPGGKRCDRVNSASGRLSSVIVPATDWTLIMEAYMKKLTALFIMLVIGVLAGCNTMQGLGKDIERGGEKLQNSAQDTKQKM